jgi:uncharacterized small protein (DUF1192 family)
MDVDDLEPRKKAAEKRNLDVMSVEELGDYIGEMEAEIVRVRAAIEHKRKAKAGAEAFFKR